VHFSRRRYKKGKSPPAQMNVKFHPDATIELIEAAHFYEERQEGLGDRLLDAVEEAIAFIRMHPTIWRSDEKGRRKYRAKRFPYLIIYKIKNDSLYILAIAHTSRKPGYWKMRDEP